MRRSGGRWECIECGAILDVHDDLTPLVVMNVSSSRPAVRVLILDGVEIHRCEIADAPVDVGSADAV